MAISKILDFIAGSKFAIKLPQAISNDWESQNCDWMLFSVTPLLNLADSLTIDYGPWQNFKVSNVTNAIEYLSIRAVSQYIRLVFDVMLQTLQILKTINFHWKFQIQFEAIIWKPNLRDHIRIINHINARFVGKDFHKWIT